MVIVSVVGARPNFVKLAPVAHALGKRKGVEHLIVHTGQHYDALMSESFFQELEIPAPSVNLEVGSASHAKQTAAVMDRFEGTCLELKPDWVLVYGDVNSTVAAALVAVKLGIKVAHVEAGLRSYDRTMPEEHNRIVTDHLVDLLLTPSRDAIATLKGEGIPAERIQFVGNVMIDTLIRLRGRAKGAAAKLGVPERGFVLVTLHRPGNVDDPATLAVICDGLAGLEGAPGDLPVSPADPPAAGRDEAAGERSAGGSGTLSGNAVPHRVRGAGGDRFRRGAGGDQLSGRAVFDGAAKHGAADHGERGDEPVDRAGRDRQGK